MPLQLAPPPNIQQLPEEERPRERLFNHGAQVLSLRECVALLLGSGPIHEGSLGLAARICDFASKSDQPWEAESFFFEFLDDPHLKPSQLSALFKGLGIAGATRLLATMEIARRYHSLKNKDSRHTRRVPPQSKFDDSMSGPGPLAYRALRQIPERVRNASVEHLGFVPLADLEQVGNYYEIDRGMRTHVNTDPIEIFRKILLLRSPAFFLVHNHPSGNHFPSEADRRLTHHVARTSEALTLRCLGHWIVSSQGESWLST